MGKFNKNSNAPTVIVTAGGTREDIDEVRFLTNISTGKLGSKIAENVLRLGWDLVYIHTETSELPKVNLDYANNDDPSNGFSKQTGLIVRSTRNAYDAIKKWVPYADVIIHSMACGDFGFTPESTKLKSNDPMAFIESLRSRIVVNPKILSEIKSWNSKIILVSFKFESGLENSKLLTTAEESMKKANGDFVVANDKQEMVKYGHHIAYLISNETGVPVITIKGKQQIAETILSAVDKKLHDR